MNLRKVFIIVIIVICIISLGIGIYFQIPKKDKVDIKNTNLNNNKEYEPMEFDNLFDNSMNYQNYNVSSENKMDPKLELVYTSRTFEQVYEEKYDIKINIPAININNEKIANINKEINTIFNEKANKIVSDADSGNMQNNIYTVEYTAYLNENILSLVIRATLKEGNSAQRVIIKAYTYNLSTNEEISLLNMLEIKGEDKEVVQNEIKTVLQDSQAKTENLGALGYSVYERNINSSIYEIENSNNYFLGPNGVIYIIYAYGNSNFTSEKDIVVIK